MVNEFLEMDFLKQNGFELMFKGRYKRNKKKRNSSIGSWKARSINDPSDQIVGYAEFTIPSDRTSAHYGAIYSDSVRNNKYDVRNDQYDRRFPTSYSERDYSREMINMKKGIVQIWFGTKRKIPDLKEYADGYYAIVLKDRKSGEYYSYDSYKSGFEEMLIEVYGIDMN